MKLGLFFTDEKLFSVAVLRTRASGNQCNITVDVFCTRVSIRSLLQHRKSIISASFLLNRELKSSGSIIERCCWCSNCCQLSVALLQTCSR